MHMHQDPLLVHTCMTSPAKWADVTCQMKPEGRRPEPLFNHRTVREGTRTLAAALAFMFAMSMAPQRPHRQWQVNANGRLNALVSIGRGADGSQLWRYTKVKHVYIVQCTENWLKHKLTIIFGYLILEILIPVVTAKPFMNVGVLCAVHHVRGFTRGNWVNIIKLTIKVLSINKDDVNKVYVAFSL